MGSVSLNGPHVEGLSPAGKPIITRSLDPDGSDLINGWITDESIIWWKHWEVMETSSSESKRRKQRLSLEPVLGSQHLSVSHQVTSSAPLNSFVHNVLSQQALKTMEPVTMV